MHSKFLRLIIFDKMTSSQPNILAFAIKEFTPFLNLDINEDITKVGTEIPIPQFRESELICLLENVLEIYKNNYPIIKLRTPVYVIGDLHGNFHDFLRIFNSIKDPFSKTFLFLGDYIDRGQFQTEIITLLLTLTAQYPSNFILLRGNHEFADVNSKSGFYEEISKVYSDRVFNLFNEVFSYLPFVAIIGNSILCLHGGIGPNLKYISQVQNITFPYKSAEDDKDIQELLWSDPSFCIEGFSPNPRGIGSLYGQVALSSFLNNNQMKTLIRGHEPTKAGVESDPRRLVYTVFSSSGYIDQESLGGFLQISRDGDIKAYTFQPAVSLLRENAVFYTPIKQKSRNKIQSVRSFRGNPNMMIQGGIQSQKQKKRFFTEEELHKENPQC